MTVRLVFLEEHENYKQYSQYYIPRKEAVILMEKGIAVSGITFDRNRSAFIKPNRDMETEDADMKAAEKRETAVTKKRGKKKHAKQG